VGLSKLILKKRARNRNRLETGFSIIILTV
jgi:hypothetical protein